jgi:prepilin-type N-terminal cleavage/methylation domain-containing protein
MIQNKQAFTLVELIVVITILAVFLSLAFISFQGYSTESRDTKRMTDIATLSK